MAIVEDDTKWVFEALPVAAVSKTLEVLRPPAQVLHRTRRLNGLDAAELMMGLAKVIDQFAEELTPCVLDREQGTVTQLGGEPLPFDGAFCVVERSIVEPLLEKMFAVEKALIRGEKLTAAGAQRITMVLQALLWEVAAAPEFECMLGGEEEVQ